MSSPPLNIFITGASRGIGRATAILAGSKGWNIGINYLSNVEAAESCRTEVERSGGKATLLPGDTSNEADVISMFDKMESAFGPINGVVVNAGITAASMPLAEMSIERMKRVFDTNILGSYLVAREAARRLPSSSQSLSSSSENKETRSIVLLSSAAARLGSPNEYIDYAGSKGAIDTLTIGLAKELGLKGVRVNAVRPGIIDTEIHASSGDPGRVERIGGMVPLGRAGSAREVAEAVVWLVGNDSSYVTGTFIDVAGGR